MSLKKDLLKQAKPKFIKAYDQLVNRGQRLKALKMMAKVEKGILPSKERLPLKDRLAHYKATGRLHRPGKDPKAGSDYIGKRDLFSEGVLDAGMDGVIIPRFYEGDLRAFKTRFALNQPNHPKISRTAKERMEEFLKVKKLLEQKVRSQTDPVHRRYSIKGGSAKLRRGFDRSSSLKEEFDFSKDMRQVADENPGLVNIPKYHDYLRSWYGGKPNPNSPSALDTSWVGSGFLMEKVPKPMSNLPKGMGMGSVRTYASKADEDAAIANVKAFMAKAREKNLGNFDIHENQIISMTPEGTFRRSPYLLDFGRGVRLDSAKAQMPPRLLGPDDISYLSPAAYDASYSIVMDPRIEQTIRGGYLGHTGRVRLDQNMLRERLLERAMSPPTPPQTPQNFLNNPQVQQVLEVIDPRVRGAIPLVQKGNILNWLKAQMANA